MHVHVHVHVRSARQPQGARVNIALDEREPDLLLLLEAAADVHIVEHGAVVEVLIGANDLEAHARERRCLGALVERFARKFSLPSLFLAR